MSELVQNGGFDSSSYWNVGSYWSISGGKAKWDCSEEGSGILSQNLSGLVAGRKYTVKFDITNSDISSSEDADMQVRLGGTSVIWCRSDGNYEINNVVAGGNGKIEFEAENYIGDPAYLEVDNVSVQEVPGASRPLVCGAGTYLGDYKEDSTIYFCWDSLATNGTLRVYKDNGTSESTAGITNIEDFDNLAGVHNCKIDLSADAFYEVGHDYSVVLVDANVEDNHYNTVLAGFSIENRFVDSALAKRAAKLLVNKAVQDKITGAIDYYDDDDQTVILTHTPTDGEMEITRTPS